MDVYPTPTPAQLLCPHPLGERRYFFRVGGSDWRCDACEYEYVPLPDYTAHTRRLRRRERKASRMKPCGACGKTRPQYDVYKLSPRTHSHQACACSERCAQALAVRFTVEDL